MSRVDLGGGRLPEIDQLVVGVAGHGSVRWAAAELGGVVEQARRRHDLSPVAATALGRALVGAALLIRISARTWSRVVVDVRGNGPLRQVLAEIDGEGNLRGLVGEPRVAAEPREDGRLPIGEAVGKGLLRVLRESDTASHESQVELVTGEIGLDLAHYLEQSEQTDSAVMLGVLARPAGVVAAGGMLVEVMPGAREEVIARLEANIAGLSGVSRLLAERGISGLRQRVLAGLDHTAVETQSLRFRCRCNRASLLDKLVLLSRDDVAALQDESGRIVAECAFCGTLYRFTAAELDVQ